MSAYSYSPVTSPRKPRTRFNDIDSSTTSSPSSSPLAPPSFAQHGRLTRSTSARHTSTSPIPARPRYTYSASSSPTVQRTDNTSTSFAAIQSQLESLQKQLRDTQSLLRTSRDGEDWWKSRVKILDRRSRDLEAENRRLTTYIHHLEEVHREDAERDGDAGSESLYEDLEDDKENCKPAKIGVEGEHVHPLEEIEGREKEREMGAMIKSLIAHHWNLQTELAVSTMSAVPCTCPAAKTIEALMVPSLVGTPVPVLDAEGKETEVELKIPPHPHPEVFQEVRKGRREGLKRKVEEMRRLVEGKKGENEVLERLLVERGGEEDEEMVGLRRGMEEVEIFEDEIEREVVGDEDMRQEDSRDGDHRDENVREEEAIGGVMESTFRERREGWEKIVQANDGVVEMREDLEMIVSESEPSTPAKDGRRLVVGLEQGVVFEAHDESPQSVAAGIAKFSGSGAIWRTQYESPL